MFPILTLLVALRQFLDGTILLGVGPCAGLVLAYSLDYIFAITLAGSKKYIELTSELRFWINNNVRIDNRTSKKSGSEIDPTTKND